MNKNWNRWIYTSIAKHFNTTIATPNSLYLYIAGRSDDTGKKSEFIELRVSPIQTTEISKNNYKINVTIDVLYSVQLVPEDSYRAQTVAGLIENAITDICVYKYGKESVDDDSFLGGLQLQRQPVESNCFGQISSDTRLIQGVVSASLQMKIRT